ncbi:integrase core domain-containing protein [Streptomyces sp. NPDC048479]|uniref:integrase core domain-containing protein n=1 Tax=Streptomyces sp. NPDC048479 TaxID=3154725 RepID=UPI003445BE7F
MPVVVAGVTTCQELRERTARGCGSCAPIRGTTRRPRSSSDHVLVKLPFAVEQVQTDNGQEFGPAFHWHLLDKGIGHVRIKPRTPRLNGKVERSHRIDSEEFYRLLEGQAIDDVNLFNTKLQEWEDYYNYDRPHGAFTGHTPYERLRQKAQNPLS